MVEHPEAWRPARRRRLQSSRRSRRAGARSASASGPSVARQARAARDGARTRPAGAHPTCRDAAARPARVVDLYRALARRIHPDSPLRAARGRARPPGRAVGRRAGRVRERSLERLLAIAAWVETLGRAGGRGRARDRSRTRARAGRPARRPDALVLRALRPAARAAPLRGCARARAGRRCASDPAWEFEERRLRRRGSGSRVGARSGDRRRDGRVRRALAELEGLLRRDRPAASRLWLGAPALMRRGDVPAGWTRTPRMAYDEGWCPRCPDRAGGRPATSVAAA